MPTELDETTPLLTVKKPVIINQKKPAPSVNSPYRSCLRDSDAIAATNAAYLGGCAAAVAAHFTPPVFALAYPMTFFCCNTGIGAGAAAATFYASNKLVKKIQGGNKNDHPSEEHVPRGIIMDK